jgi:uncharacterized protein YggE
MFSRKLVYFSVLIVAALAFAAAGALAALTSAPTNALAGGGPGRAQAAGIVAQATGSVIDRGITVVGVGTAAGTPDVAHVSVGIETSAPSVQQAVDDNKGKMAALLEALKALGVADKDIQTNNYSVYTQQGPVAPDGTSDSSAVTYHTSNQVEVTVRDVSKLGDILDKAVAAGANNIYGVNFSVDDTSKLEADARAKAIADAKARAASLAQLTGLQLGDIVSVSEVISSNVPMYAADRAVGMGGGGTPIQPGELNVNMSVQVTFAIK